MKLFVAAISLAFFSLITWNCTKIDTTTIGSGLIPAVDNVNTFDTIINVISNNFDSANIDCAKIYPIDDRPLGYISNDPYFGTTNAVVYAEMKPTFPFTFHTSLSRTLDSVVIILKYTRSYGDSTKAQKLNVYQLTDQLVSFDSSTCTFHDFDLTNKLGSVTYTPTNLGDTTPLRINLKTSMQTFFSNDANFLGDTAFRLAFHGFAISPDISFPGSNSLSYFNLADTNTKMVIYYKYIDTLNKPAKDTIASFNLSNDPSGYAQSASWVNRSHTGGEYLNHVGNNSNPNGDDPIYIQTNPGTYALVQIPGLANVSNRIIHRAELIMDQVYSPAPIDSYFSTPNYLFLDYKDTGSNNFHLELCDFNFSSTAGPNLTEFGGYRTYALDNAGKTISRYVFNISRYVQNIITKHLPPRVFRLYSPSLVSSGTILLSDPLCNSGAISYPLFLLNQPVAGRVKLYGGNNTNAILPNKMRLHIVYSKI